MSKEKGKFITLEGGEGAGKSTNVQFIKNYLEERNFTVTVTREPGGTKLAENIRGLLLNNQAEEITSQTEILLMFAARSQHINQVIKPALERGDWVISDRFTDATYAYQGGGRGIDKAAIAWLENFVQENLTPDLTLLLDMPVEIGMTRVKSRGGDLDRFETERSQFFDKVRNAYLEQARQYSGRIKIVMADQSLTDVQQAIASWLNQLFV